MPGFQCGTTGLTGGGTNATTVVTTNARVKTQQGYVGLVADIVQFPGSPIIGNWIVPATRCQVSHTPVINSSSTGLAYRLVSGALVPGPMQVSSPDSHASGQ